MSPRSAAEPVFIVDECMGPGVVEAIVEAGGKAVLLTDRAGRGALDVDWIPRCAQWGQALITRDDRIRTNAYEADALRASNVHVFIIRCHGAKLAELRTFVTTHLNTMRRYIQRDEPPFIARITKTGLVVVETGGRRGAVKRD